MTKKFKLLKGDNLITLKKIPDNSIDSIVTDPPYGLSFMNKKWDYDVPSVEFWKEIYRVLKPDSEADDEWELKLEQYVDDCILQELPKQYRPYFDSEAWKQDAKYNGRGTTLSSYNNQEIEQTVNGTTYYLYRQN